MKKTLKKNQQALIAGLVLIALVIAYFKRDQIKEFFSKSDKSPSNSAATTVNTATSTPSTLSENDIVLKKGSSGIQVRKLQQLLNDHHRQNKPTFIPVLVEDAKFGGLTEAMLKKYTGKTSISIHQLLKALS